MSKTTGRLTRWAVAALGAMTLGALTVAPASAQPNIDPDATGSITVHKYEEPAEPTGLPNDGTELDELTGLVPLEGVEFTLHQVEDIDLTTNDGWQAADGLTAQDVIDGSYTLGAPQALRTDVDGELVFGDLPVGVYLITETDAGGNPISNAAAPFLVSIPLPDAANGWLYDVHVYPKNAVTNTSKEVDDADAFGLGDTVTWTVNVDIPTLPADETFQRFGISDTLDERLGYETVRVYVDEVELEEDVHYTVSFDAATNTVSVDFTEVGLTLIDASQGGAAAFEIDTEVLAIGDGVITNVANVNVNDYEGETNEVETRWGAVVIEKFAEADGERAPLAGAEFQIFRSAADAAELADPVAVNGQTTFVSGEDGRVTIEGLKEGEYWIVETEAPVGYVGTEEPIHVEVEAGSIAETVVVEVENSQRPPFELPLTGGMGTAAFLVGGLGLAGLAVGAGVRRQRAGRSA